MIIVRVGLAREQGLSRGSLTADPSALGSYRGSLGFRHAPPRDHGQSLAVAITQFIETDSGSSPENVDGMSIELKMSGPEGASAGVSKT